MEHQMKLVNSAFNAIKNKTKTIEMRLNDEKRRLINIGDYIVFQNINTLELLKCVVIDLFKYPSFKELYMHHDKISIGYMEDEEAKYQDMYEYYSIEAINKFGVLGIKIKVVD